MKIFVSFDLSETKMGLILPFDFKFQRTAIRPEFNFRLSDFRFDILLNKMLIIFNSLPNSIRNLFDLLFLFDFL